MRIAMRYNARFFSKASREVILVLDEPSQEKGVLDLAKEYKNINWRIIINRKDHDWRNPAKALNVGIRHATKDYVYIQSPETVILDDVPGKLLKTCANEGFAYGNVKFCKVDEKEQWTEPIPKFPYGNIVIPKGPLLVLKGYDEQFDGWGGDDDNLRKRLEKIGVLGIHNDKAMVYHLERGERPKKRITLHNYLRLDLPVVPDNKDWGVDFKEIILDYKQLTKS